MNTYHAPHRINEALSPAGIELIGARRVRDTDRARFRWPCGHTVLTTYRELTRDGADLTCPACRRAELADDKAVRAELRRLPWLQGEAAERYRKMRLDTLRETRLFERQEAEAERRRAAGEDYDDDPDEENMPPPLPPVPRYNAKAMSYEEALLVLAQRAQRMTPEHREKVNKSRLLVEIREAELAQFGHRLSPATRARQLRRAQTYFLYLAGLSAGQIADIIGTTTGTVTGYIRQNKDGIL